MTHTGELTGEFANLTDEHFRDGLFLGAITYNPSDVTIDLLQAAPGDVDGDQDIDNFDIAQILISNSFGAGFGPWDWTQGDFTGDGIVDNFDIAEILLTNLFGTGLYAALPASLAATVPEPSTFVLAVLGLLGLVGYGWRKGPARRRLPAAVTTDRTGQGY